MITFHLLNALAEQFHMKLKKKFTWYKLLCKSHLQLKLLSLFRLCTYTCTDPGQSTV